ncbi:MAG: response regulator [Candidatus Omnitrophota bacterium]|nr:response regulator [Candidatus Omnitrophota bacterium]MBU1929644.1 response regulator [Candidatus Omnitrophota bacterium]MBU2035400.1 response regulator [Candidatus Omnitrophota bacterium]MBU2221940.1 response regulator [Candidatus Omnitrophota bacterium]
MEDRRLKLLIVDDEVDIRESLSRILERYGYSVLTAQDGEEGLNIINEHDIDIVLCDIGMPKMDGIEFLKNIRKFTLKAEVIIITGQSTIDRCVDAIEQNTSGYLLKPLKTEDILDNIRRAEKRVEEKKKMLELAFSDKQKK